MAHSQVSSSRLDKLGRRIGYNWWRELIISSFIFADLVWSSKQEDDTFGYETEKREFAHSNPRPTLKSFMIYFAGGDPNAEDTGGRL
jgi:hypothetical protein